MRTTEITIALLLAVAASLPAAFAEDQTAAAYVKSLYPPDDPSAAELRYTPRTAKL